MENINWLAGSALALPPDLADLPTITAELWTTVDTDPALFIEGPGFDRDGNLYVCCSVPVPGVDPRVYKITPEGCASILCYTGDVPVMGLAIHQNGRLFIAAMHSGILVLSPDGEVLDHFQPTYNGIQLAPNDVAFHANGNLYLTDFRGSCEQPDGGIYCLKQEDAYHTAVKICGGFIFPNGLSFSPDFRCLWIGESGRNAIWQVALNSEGFPGGLGVPLCCVYKSAGSASMDGNRTDAAGYLYQAVNHGGRVLVLNAAGIPAGNVVIPERTSGKYDMTANLALRPGAAEAYLLASGSAGIHIFRFPTYAAAPRLYSHMQHLS